jgi:hypothetical protein
MVKKVFLYLFALFFCSGIGSTIAQDNNDLDQISFQDSSFLPSTQRDLPDQIDVDFLFNYYDQEGNNSAVTGGLGTEELNDYSSIILVNIPTDSADWVQINAGINVYTSASTDRIDTRVSSASFRDARGRMFLTYHKALPSKNQFFQVMGGGSIESDYVSSSFGGGWGWVADDRNRDLYLGFHSYQDTWMLIFPDEIRDTGRDIAPTSRRSSYNLTANFNQVINKKLQIGLSTDLVIQQGMLATPFHRVYFQMEQLPRVEKLPLTRIKWPISVRANYYWADWLVSRTFYRFYWDNFALQAHSIQTELAFKPSLYLSVYPSYRFHIQSAAQYFQPFGMHDPGATFFTSDYDLSAFHSHKLSMSLNYKPLYGIGRFKLGKQRIGLFDEVELRYSRYWRSNGLESFLFGLQMGFKL